METDDFHILKFIVDLKIVTFKGVSFCLVTINHFKFDLIHHILIVKESEVKNKNQRHLEFTYTPIKLYVVCVSFKLLIRF